MNQRERFQRIMDYKPVDKIPVMAVEPFEKTALSRWFDEGLESGGTPEEALGMDRFDKVPISLTPIPRFEHKIFYEDNECIVETDTTYGAKVKKMKIAPSMFYGFLDHQVKTMDDWKRIKFRYEGMVEKRIPKDINAIVSNLNASENPVKLEIFPYFFRLGFYLMGMERFMLAFYDQRELIHEMFSFWNDFVLKMIRLYLTKVNIDIFVLAEDLAYNSAPHLSPDIYKEFWLPYQDVLVKEVKKHNIKNICLWTAGDIDKIIPLLMEHGINCIWPVERCSPNMNPLILRKKYGKGLRMSGGIPKSCLLLGIEAIDAEIDKLMPLVLEGGFIPALDDMVSPEVSLNNYRYYIEKLKSISL